MAISIGRHKLESNRPTRINLQKILVYSGTLGPNHHSSSIDIFTKTGITKTERIDIDRIVDSFTNLVR